MPPIDAESRAIGEVVVFLRVSPKDSRPSSAESVRDQYEQSFKELNKSDFSQIQGKQYDPKLRFPSTPFQIMTDNIHPYLTAVQGGEPVVFLDRTASRHMISLVPPGSDRMYLSLDSEEMGSNELAHVRASADGTFVQITDQLDGWISAGVLVFNHHLFSVTDATGAFEITNVPRGKVDLAVREGHEFAKIVDSKADKQRTLTVDVDREIVDVGIIDVFFLTL